jgi:hypothetical protein
MLGQELRYECIVQIGSKGQGLAYWHDAQAQRDAVG